MLSYPPPHYVLFEPLNDLETQREWVEYKKHHESVCEFTEVDAAQINSVETFAPWFYNWVSQVPEKQATRFRVLMIWHSEFLTFSCQQMLRRSLEERSFKCRVWFHIEDPTQLQPAIQSRCIIKRMDTPINKPRLEQL